MALSLRHISPLLRGDDWWEIYDYPASILDQCFGTHLLDSDLLEQSYYRGHSVRPRTQANIAASGKSEVMIDGKEFKVVLNVSQFKPDELEVKVVNNFVVVHGKHEERKDDHGYVSREFTRSYMLPKSCEKEAITSVFSSDGLLTISAPRKLLETPPVQERLVPITQEAVKEQ